jgi:hypothetical protein
MSVSAEKGAVYPNQQKAKRGDAARFGRKRLPPFGRELLNIRMRGLVPATMIVVGLDTWNYGMAYARCVIPANSEPVDFNFDFVAGLDTVVIREPSLTTPERRDSALRELLACNPASLRCIELSDPIEWLWVKSRKNGLEKPEYLK